jgi:hypothetical protein
MVPTCGRYEGLTGPQRPALIGLPTGASSRQHRHHRLLVDLLRQTQLSQNRGLRRGPQGLHPHDPRVGNGYLEQQAEAIGVQLRQNRHKRGQHRGASAADRVVSQVRSRQRRRRRPRPRGVPERLQHVVDPAVGGPRFLAAVALVVVKEGGLAPVREI